ncbi:MAG: hypothetical protein ABSG15_02200 [FCB group bacterium]|jgi:hypothetical protein
MKIEKKKKEKMDKENFLLLSDIWKHRDIDAKELRKKAWKIKDKNEEQNDNSLKESKINSLEIKSFIKEKSYLFWWIKEDEKENISEEFLVQQILSYGNMDDLRKLFKLLGIDRIAEIFYKQTAPDKKRVNYHPRTRNFFNLYFQKHASGNINKRTD